MIFVTGDTHGAHRNGFNSVDGYMHRFNTNAFPEQHNMTKDDFVIIAGDFGGIWQTDNINAQESNSEKYELDWLESKPFTTLFIPGNHENYDRLTGNTDKKLLDCWLFEKLTPEGRTRLEKGYPKKAWHGGFVREIRPSVLMLEHGYVYDINNCSIFAFGGAQSHDISDGILNPYDFESNKEFMKKYNQVKWGMVRVNGVSWWKQEMPTQEIMDRGIKNAKNAGKVDYVITHEAPASDKILLGYEANDPLSRYFERIRDVMTYKTWFFGHMHINRRMSDNTIALYEQIIQIN